MLLYKGAPPRESTLFGWRNDILRRKNSEKTDDGLFHVHPSRRARHGVTSSTAWARDRMLCQV